jgi:hypothetical protein
MFRVLAIHPAAVRQGDHILVVQDHRADQEPTVMLDTDPAVSAARAAADGGVDVVLLQPHPGGFSSVPHTMHLHRDDQLTVMRNQHP